ncbi:uncharacterized protein LOC131948694 [Physella acuta]|uniref:uncharacterized protein LOC131948694 n=1 Tax=Physella acuta TaxID=109671 RepID=UPI0027DD5AAE|nr:uncharacterized protein LOC131948694 [Physella acuta]
MPLADRTIRPVWLGRRPLSEEEKTEDLVQTAVSQNAVLGALVQLASLVRHADDIFCDLAEECQKVFDKTESITGKLVNVEGIIKQLDSTEVKIPVGTLKQFSHVSEHHVAKHGFDCDHFTPLNRPHSIKFNYSLCDVTPVHALRGVDMYRKDGLCSSHLFKLWPIVLNETNRGVDDLDLPRTFTSPLSHKKSYKTLKIRERRKTIQVIDEVYQDRSGDLQASRDDHLSSSQPSMLVPVDTSGSKFERMASFRRSLREDRELGDKKRKQRRRTVSGVPESFMQELEQFERGRRIERAGSRTYSLDDLDQKELDAKDEVMQQYLQEIDAAIAEREEEEYAEQREAKLLKFLPCRRSRSLPRCVKLISASKNKDGLTRSSLYIKKSQQKAIPDEYKHKQQTDVPNKHKQQTDGPNKFVSSSSLASVGDNRSSRSSKRSSLIGEKIKSLVSGTLKPRPKSLDFDSVEVKLDNEASKKGLSRAKSVDRSLGLSRASSPSMPDGIMSRATSNESQIGPGSYYYFNSNTLPRAQAKKYDFPWDSLPKDWTTSVKLREISKRRKEDRQSSSGNWSGYSSNRQSMDSDTKSSQPSTFSQHSLGKDSGRDSPHSAGERDGLDAGYMGDAASTETISDTKSMSNTDSDEWLRSLAERAASRGDVTSTSAEALANLSRLTKQNIRNLDILVPGRRCLRQRRNELEDDGESSVYSLDTEGFYTSFHNDSGLRKSTNTLLDEEDDDLMMPRDCPSVQSAASYSTIESVIFRTLDQDGSDTLTSSVSSPHLASLGLNNTYQLSNISPLTDGSEIVDDVEDVGTLRAKKDKKRKAPPPPPPPRISSNAPAKEQGWESSQHDASPTGETSSESSDHEVIYARLKKKTSISVLSFPSWCPGMTSDEEELAGKEMSASQERLNAESSEVEKMFEAGTLPRAHLTFTSPAPSESFDLTANSWPRIKRSNVLQPGILKTSEKFKPSSNLKSLNFDPVVSLFDAQSKHSVQLPLSRLSSSDDSTSTPPNDSLDTTACNSPLDAPPSLLHLPLPPSMSSHHDCRQRVQSDRQTFNIDSSTSEDPSECNKDQTASNPNPKSTKRNSTITGEDSLQHLSSDFSSITMSSSLSLASFDSFDDPAPTLLKSVNKSSDTHSSSSTIALSDIDNTSLTHVTDFTPSGSTVSLNWDTDDTPNITPHTDDTPNITPQKTIDSSRHFNKTVSSSSLEIKKFPAQTYAKPTSASSPAQDSYSNTQFPSSSDSYQSSLGHRPTKPSTRQAHDSIPAEDTLHKYTSDNNNNKSHVSYGEPSVAPPSQTQGFSQSEPSSQPSHPRSWSQHGSTHRPAHRRSMGEARTDSSSSVHSGNESSGSSTRGSDVTRRRSGTDAYSPADSGFGSPSVPAQVSSAGNSFSYSPSGQQQFSYTAQGKHESPHIKQQLLLEKKSNFVSRPAASSSHQRADYPLKALSTSSANSSESLSSQFSVNSTSQLVGRVTKTDLSQPSLHSGTSSESLHSNSSAGRSDSYRVALLTESDQINLIPKQKHPTNHSLQATTNSNHSLQATTKTNHSLQATTYSNHSLQATTKNNHSLQATTYSNHSLQATTKNNHSLQATTYSNPSQGRAVSAPCPGFIDDNVSRADSYRCAVRNTQSSYLSDLAGRNSSYRLATCEEDVIISDHRMDACNLWTGTTGASRDVRRMGITDVDQLKHYSNEADNRRTSKNTDTLHARKRLSVRSEGDAHNNPSKSSPTEQKKFMRSNSKDKSKQKTQSSTYIRFDPIFESGEDLRASSESLRPPSIVSIKTLARADSNDGFSAENAHLIGLRSNPGSQARKRSGSLGRKSSDEKSNMTIFDSIKTTIKSIGAGKDNSYK